MSERCRLLKSNRTLLSRTTRSSQSDTNEQSDSHSVSNVQSTRSPGGPNTSPNKRVNLNTGVFAKALHGAVASSADRTVKMRKKGEQNMDRLNKRDSEGSYGRREHGSRTVRERARKVSVLGQRYDLRGVKF